MYATDAIDNFRMVKIEQAERIARAHRLRMLVGPEDGSPRPPSLQPLRNERARLAAAVAMFVASLSILAAAALA